MNYFIILLQDGQYINTIILLVLYQIYRLFILLYIYTFYNRSSKILSRYLHLKTIKNIRYD